MEEWRPVLLHSDLRRIVTEGLLLPAARPVEGGGAMMGGACCWCALRGCKVRRRCKELSCT